jgi:Cu(I)/Ag(I) efflux system membrane fusion protein
VGRTVNWLAWKRAALAAAGVLGLVGLLAAAWLVLEGGVGTGNTAHQHGSAEPAVGATTTAVIRREVTVDNATLDRLGIVFSPVRREFIATAVRHVAIVTAAESRIAHVHARVSGWIEELHVDTTAARVRRGQPLAGIFSQELFASQIEYLAVRERNRDSPSTAVLDAARLRLAVLGMSESDIRAIEDEGVARRLVTVLAPHDGIVLRRGVSVGTAIDPSTELMTIADLSEVWVIAELPEADAGAIEAGEAATLEFPGVARAPLTAVVDFVYPTVTERTRTVRVRFIMPNQDGALRPGTYGTATFGAAGRDVLTIPREAVVQTGDSRHVFVKTEQGMLEPRHIRLGRRLPDRLEVLEGLSAGEEVVSSGVFLIDSESRLGASSAGVGHVGHEPPQ